MMKRKRELSEDNSQNYSSYEEDDCYVARLVLHSDASDDEELAPGVAPADVPSFPLLDVPVPPTRNNTNVIGSHVRHRLHEKGQSTAWISPDRVPTLLRDFKNNNWKDEKNGKKRPGLKRLEITSKKCPFANGYPETIVVTIGNRDHYSTVLLARFELDVVMFHTDSIPDYHAKEFRDLQKVMVKIGAIPSRSRIRAITVPCNGQNGGWECGHVALAVTLEAIDLASGWPAKFLVENGAFVIDALKNTADAKLKKLYSQ